MSNLIKQIVDSDLFSLIVGVAGIIAAFAAVIAVRNTKTIIKNTYQDSNNTNKQKQSTKGDGNKSIQGNKNQIITGRK